MAETKRRGATLLLYGGTACFGIASLFVFWSAGSVAGSRPPHPGGAHEFDEPHEDIERPLALRPLGRAEGFLRELELAGSEESSPEVADRIVGLIQEGRFGLDEAISAVGAYPQRFMSSRDPDRGTTLPSEDRWYLSRDRLGAAIVRALSATEFDAWDRLGRHAGSALMAAAYFGLPHTVEELLGVGASPTALDRYGFDALFHAARGRSAESVRVLLAAGATPLRPMSDGRRLVDLVREETPFSSPEVDALLLAAGVDAPE